MWESYSLISAREHYLTQLEVEGFTDFLSDFISGRAFDPPYLTQTYRPKVQYCFTSVQDAWEQYIQEVPNRDFQRRLLEYESALKDALQKRDDLAFFEVVKSIFDENSLLFRSNKDALLAMKDLCEGVAFVVRQFSDDSPDENAFGRVYGPRMTGFFSRIYATLIPDFLTYDSRIAAGLCYFVREYCLANHIDLPGNLQLGSLHGWGKNKKDVGRNASWGQNVFPALDTIKKAADERTYFCQIQLSCLLACD